MQLLNLSDFICSDLKVVVKVKSVIQFENKSITKFLDEYMIRATVSQSHNFNFESSLVISAGMVNIVREK